MALQGNWKQAHEIAQKDEADPLSCWLHAVLHRQEGDDFNARYWYQKAGKKFPNKALDVSVELNEILSIVNKESLTDDC